MRDHLELELAQYVALSALRDGYCTEDHLISIHAAAMLAAKLSGRPPHIEGHLGSALRLSVEALADIRSGRQPMPAIARGLLASMSVLLPWIAAHSNKQIADVIPRLIKEINK